MTSALQALLAGLSTGLGLIVAIGAQNAWVIRQGVRREGVGLVVAICIACDVSLIALGTAGVGALAEAVPWLLAALKWGGVVYLLRFAYLSARSALTASASLESAPSAPARGTIALTTLGVSLLNPHVYLDTVLMLGTVTSSFGSAKWWAATGAMAASTAWFAAIGYGARTAAPVLERPRTWRILDGLVALVMVAVAARLAFGQSR